MDLCGHKKAADAEENPTYQGLRARVERMTEEEMEAITALVALENA